MPGDGARVTSGRAGIRGEEVRVVIHAGIHRTGTTSLQRFLSANRAALAARGIGYPGTEVHHQKLAWALKRRQSDAQDVLALISTVEADTVILSGEDFSIHESLDWLAELAARRETHAVLYLRRQDHWVMSWYNQHVKWPFSPWKSQLDPQEFLATLEDFHWLDYARLLERWGGVLGRDRIGIGVVERGQVENVTGDFLQRLGIDPGGLVFDETRSNDSLPVHLLEIARNLGLYELKPRQRMRLLEAIRTGLADKAPAAATVYSPEERNRILDRFADSNRRVAREFLARDALFLEPPPAPDAPHYRFPDLPPNILIREWMAPVVRELLKSAK
jgi:hypothetical protein